MLAKDAEARFAALDAFLIEHQGLWRPRPFTHLHLPWETQHPELAQWLRQRSLADADSCHNHPHDLPAPAPFPQLAEQALQLSAVDKLPTQTLQPARHRLNVDVPGRKWQQIEAFGAALHFAQTPTHWLDWCAGKGHLGRRLLQPGQQLTCLEYDPALIASGQALSEHHGLPATHRLQDVMAPVSISADHTPVALHACGDLHVRLLQLASAAGCKQLALAPCCYNRINADRYQAVSDAGRASKLKLSIDDLGLPLSETVTAGNRVRQQRDSSMARRLGFDQLQRQLRGCDEYLPTPSLPANWLDKPFADYCRALASLKGLSTGEQDWAALEAHGWRRLAHVRNLELVRGLFRRPLEMWLVLDRALFLAEQGYKVEIGNFCETTLTPRNLMVLAERD
ncbi:SAM-dependent methyltransferase [Pseudomonas sp. IB20]|uniref:methyltransferase n=1 Tax=Pseudomonas TaxID=286 RepID=UPI000BA02670|nr:MULTISPECIES: methyltransferase [unclassified Pseudomonas]MCV2226631.1 SAM-dependent methyltransferase [Pseudomonas sp. AU10]OZO01946.1 SAM-dependent methyltransferase [Pseudomonas sp. IB20]